jgi:protein TonB
MKNLNAPLEKKRPLLFMAGLVFALSVTLVSFEWRTPYEVIKIADHGTHYTDDPIWIPITLPEPRPSAERPELPKAKPLSDELIITDKKPLEPMIEPMTDPIEPKLPIGPKAPEKDVDDEDLKIRKIPSVMPEYCKGEAAMFSFLAEELKYPEIPRVNGISGTVYAQFVVGKDGKVRDAQVVRPIDPWLDAEALRAAKLLDCFEPGKQAGRNVDVYFILPVRFTLSH